MNALKFNPRVFRVETTIGGMIAEWNLLTVDGETPRDTVYFMTKGDAPSCNDADQIVDAIEQEDWEEVDFTEIADFNINMSAFEGAGEGYSEIVKRLQEILK